MRKKKKLSDRITDKVIIELDAGLLYAIGFITSIFSCAFDDGIEKNKKEKKEINVIDKHCLGGIDDKHKGFVLDCCHIFREFFTSLEEERPPNFSDHFKSPPIREIDKNEFDKNLH